MRPLIRRPALAIAAALAASVSLSSAPPAAWPGFRGPDMSGLALDAKLPDTWSKTKNVKWVIDVPGRGWSSPIVAGNTLFLTSAISGKPFKQPSPGIYGNDYIA